MVMSCDKSKVGWLFSSMLETIRLRWPLRVRLPRWKSSWVMVRPSPVAIKLSPLPTISMVMDPERGEPCGPVHPSSKVTTMVRGSASTPLSTTEAQSGRAPKGAPWNGPEWHPPGVMRRDSTSSLVNSDSRTASSRVTRFSAITAEASCSDERLHPVTAKVPNRTAAGSERACGLLMSNVFVNTR